ncbi:MAG: hypothetical protein CL565_01825 [Alphaproteobacteria bacterium]|nr:hypothetical protein [Alphaproteobacteria bacterium]|tara:strand:- start:67 stop:651 length:585 start_codon:yes stop_codon:yes gene_type:complete
MKLSDVEITDFSGLNSLNTAFNCNADMYVRLQFLEFKAALNEKHFVITTPDHKVVAVGSVRPSNLLKGQLFMHHISVDPEFKNQGCATKIVRAIYQYAQDNSFVLTPTRFEEEGMKYLAPTMAKLHREFPDLPISYPCNPNSVDDKPITGERDYEISYFRKLDRLNKIRFPANPETCQDELTIGPIGAPPSMCR